MIALVDGTAIAFNNCCCTLSAMLSARAAMETFAVLADLETRVSNLLSAEDLGGLDAIAQKGIFASRNP
jgi:hypothetical protein